MPKTNEKIALITGGTSGIGKQTAVALARLGAWAGGLKKAVWDKKKKWEGL